MKLLPYWHRKLTHGYCAWGIYIYVAVNFAADHIDVVADAFSWWIAAPLLIGALALSLFKQASVSGKDADEQAA